MYNVEDILIKPLLTEKISVQTETLNRYGFQVALHSNKHQIKGAIEKLFDVKVMNVKTSITPGHEKRFKKGIKKYSKVKKAYVQVKEGQKIEFFKGI
jgi:large subunit ribosomal protein L23